MACHQLFLECHQQRHSAGQPAEGGEPQPVWDHCFQPPPESHQAAALRSGSVSSCVSMDQVGAGEGAGGHGGTEEGTLTLVVYHSWGNTYIRVCLVWSRLWTEYDQLRNWLAGIKVPKISK